MIVPISNFQVKEITARDCYPIRQQVLWQHKEIDQCGIAADLESSAFHLGVFHEDELVCIGSFFSQKNPNFREPNQYRLRAMATLPSFQKKGTAKLLLSLAFQKLRSDSQKILWCDARIVAVGFYERLGFLSYGESYEIPVIGAHYLMSKRI